MPLESHLLEASFTFAHDKDPLVMYKQCHAPITFRKGQLDEIASACSDSIYCLSDRLQPDGIGFTPGQAEADTRPGARRKGSRYNGAFSSNRGSGTLTSGCDLNL
jgi:hypothetical protein